MTPLKTRTPTLYLEHGTLRVNGSAVVWEADEQQIDVPIDRVATLLLGPGSTVTHAAIKACANVGTLVQWVGEGSTRAYAAADPLAGDGERIKSQVLVAASQARRMRAVSYMFKRRFGVGPLAPELDDATVRGMEGARVKPLYAKFAVDYKVPWTGRITGDWNHVDPVNRIISMANGHLVQVATVAVVAAGFSPAIGFSHAGFNRAYACDIADLHKFAVSVPLAFQLFAKGMRDSRKEVRHAIRDEVVRLGLVDQMIRDAVEVVDAGLGRL